MKKETAASWSDMHFRESRRRQRTLFFVFLIAVYLVSVAVLWTIIYSPLFRVKNVEITGNKNVPSEDIMTLMKADIYRGSFTKRALGMRNILIWPQKFSEDILKFYPEVKSASVEKNYLERKIRIVVEEKQPFGVWCLKGLAGADANTTAVSSDCFWFDSDGIIFKKAMEVEGNLIISLNDYSQKNLGLNRKILPDRFVSNIFSIFKAVSQSGLRVKEMRFNNLSLEEMEVDTYNGLPTGSSLKAGPKIYFSLRFPADNIPDIINSLKEKSSFNGLQYVDFRVENRVYYK